MKCRHPDNGQAAQGVNGVKSFDRLHVSDYLEIRRSRESANSKFPANAKNKEQVSHHGYLRMLWVTHKRVKKPACNF